MSKLRVAVIGAGRLGGFHAQKLAKLEQTELVAVADPVAAQRERVAAECRTQAVADYRDLFGKIDAAVIATPTVLHHAVSMDMLQRGVHLLVEKPICPTSAEAEELVDLARRKGLTLQVGHVERFNPAMVAARSQLPSPPKYIEATRASTFTFRSTDVGVVMDVMIHDLDLVLSLVRSKVRRVDALGFSVMGGHEDAANVRLVFESGCVAVLNACRVSYEQVRRMHLWTHAGFAAIDFASRRTTIVRPSEALLRRQFDVDSLTPEQLQHKEELLQQHLRREDQESAAVDALALEDADFVESIRAGRPPQVTGEDGMAAVALAESILAKIAEHAWDDQVDGLVGPRAIPRPSVIPAPHFSLVPNADKARREAG